MNPLPRIPSARGTEPGVISPRTWDQLVESIAELDRRILSLRPKSSPEIKVRNLGSPEGYTLALARRSNAGPAAPGPCPFGRIYSQTTTSEEPVTTYHLRGGAVSAGPGVWNVFDHEIDCTTDGIFVLWVETDVVANEEDGLILPGLASSSVYGIGQGSVYPSQVLPTVESEAAGTSIVPLGSIQITDGIPTLEPSGCGSITVHHCPGSLTYTRG